MGPQLLPPPITGDMITDSESVIKNARKNDQYGLPSAGIHTHPQQLHTDGGGALSVVAKQQQKHRSQDCDCMGAMRKS